MALTMANGMDAESQLTFFGLKRTLVSYVGQLISQTGGESSWHNA